MPIPLYLSVPEEFVTVLQGFWVLVTNLQDKFCLQETVPPLSVALVFSDTKVLFPAHTVILEKKSLQKPGYGGEKSRAKELFVRSVKNFCWNRKIFNSS